VAVRAAFADAPVEGSCVECGEPATERHFVVTDQPSVGFGKIVLVCGSCGAARTTRP
jgi:thymidine kinase